jgi:hypothetical protein
MKFTSDVDIDFGDRASILRHIQYRRASLDGNVPHNTGVYVTEIPHDPITNTATIDFRSAEQRGYIKLDFLNVSVYNQIHSEQQLTELMQQKPNWHKLLDQEFCAQLIHIGNHWDTLGRMPEPVDSIARLAMFLAIIRPGKRHLIGRPWREVAETIWQKPESGYYFKKAHAVSYAHLVAVHMNLLELTNQSN